MMSLKVFCTFVVFCFFCIVPVADAQGMNRYTEISEKVIAQIDISTFVQNSLSISNDGRRAAYVIKYGKKRYVVVDGKKSKAYDEIGSIEFSPDGKHVAFLASSGKKHFAVIDGQEETKFRAVFEGSPIIFSPDSSYVTYNAESGNKFFVVANGKADKKYDYISNSRFFSEDGMHVAYEAQTGNKGFVVFDGKELEKYDSVSKIIFSPDSKHCAYIARTGNKAFAVVDRIAQSSYESVSDIIFSLDSKNIAYRATLGGKELVVVNGRQEKKFERVLDLQFSPDGNRHAYFAYEAEKWRVIVDGVELKQFYGDELERGSFAFSPDSRRVAYVAQTGNKHFVVVDGKDGKKYDGAWLPKFSPDSKRVAYVAQKGKKEFMVVDGIESQHYDLVRVPVFSPDSVHLAYEAELNKEYFVAVNGVVGKRFDKDILGMLKFDSDRRLHYNVWSENGIELIEETIKALPPISQVEMTAYNPEEHSIKENRKQRSGMSEKSLNIAGGDFRKFGRPDCNISVKDVVKTSDGFVLAGSVQSKADGSSWGWVLKTDKNGNKLWEKELGRKARNSVFEKVVSSNDSELILGGLVNVVYKPEQQAGTWAASNGWIVRMMSNGAIEWDRNLKLKEGVTYKGVDVEISPVVLVWDARPTRGGDIIVVGNVRYGVNDEPVFWKLDGRGKVIWTKRLETEKNMSISPEVVFPLSDGGFLVGGDSIDQDLTQGTGIWLTRRDKNGNEMWEKTFAAGREFLSMAIAELKDGTFVAGTVVTEKKKKYVWLTNFKKDGAIVWTNKTELPGACEMVNVWSAHNDEIRAAGGTCQNEMERIWTAKFSGSGVMEGASTFLKVGGIGLKQVIPTDGNGFIAVGNGNQGSGAWFYKSEAGSVIGEIK